jgi:hypothetical protein
MKFSIDDVDKMYALMQQSRLEQQWSTVYTIADKIIEVQKAHIADIESKYEVLKTVREHGCECSDEEACAFVREIYKLNKNIETLQGELYYKDSQKEPSAEISEIDFQNDIIEPEKN